MHVKYVLLPKGTTSTSNSNSNGNTSGNHHTRYSNFNLKHNRQPQSSYTAKHYSTSSSTQTRTLSVGLGVGSSAQRSSGRYAASGLLDLASWSSIAFSRWLWLRAELELGSGPSTSCCTVFSTVTWSWGATSALCVRYMTHGKGREGGRERVRRGSEERERS